MKLMMIKKGAGLGLRFMDRLMRLGNKIYFLIGPMRLVH